MPGVESTAEVRCLRCLETVRLRRSHKRLYGDPRSGWYYPTHRHRVEKKRYRTCDCSGRAVTADEAERYGLEVL